MKQPVTVLTFGVWSIGLVKIWYEPTLCSNLCVAQFVFNFNLFALQMAHYVTDIVHQEWLFFWKVHRHCHM